MKRSLRFLSIALLAVMSLLHLGETPVSDQQESVKSMAPAALGTGLLIACNPDRPGCKPPIHKPNCGVRG